jgi:hypothetical protein
MTPLHSRHSRRAGGATGRRVAARVQLPIGDRLEIYAGQRHHCCQRERVRARFARRGQVRRG